MGAEIERKSSVHDPFTATRRRLLYVDGDAALILNRTRRRRIRQQIQQISNCTIVNRIRTGLFNLVRLISIAGT